MCVSPLWFLRARACLAVCARALSRAIHDCLACGFVPAHLLCMSVASAYVCACALVSPSVRDWQPLCP